MKLKCFTNNGSFLSLFNSTSYCFINNYYVWWIFCVITSDSSGQNLSAVHSSAYSGWGHVFGSIIWRADTCFCIFHFCSCPVSSVQLIWICKPCWHALIWLGQLNFCTMIRLGGYLPTSVSKDYKLVLVCDVNDCLNKGRAGGSEYLSHCITLLCRLIREETSPTLDERELTGRMT